LPGLVDLPWWIWTAVAVALFAVTVLLRHYFWVRLPLWIFHHTIWRLHIHGRENVPRTGPALLISNHISWLDSLILMAAAPFGRRVRFVIWAPFLDIPVLKWIFHWGHVIPIDARGGPRSILKSLKVASDALADGHLVCIFAEGAISRIGYLRAFQRGFEQVVKKTPAPIIPVALDHLWGSVFSYSGGRFFRKWPEEFPRHHYCTFGQPMPADSTPFAVRQQVQALLAESAIRRRERMPLVHQRFVRLACRHPFRSCIIDPIGTKPQLNYAETLTGVKILNRRLGPLLRGQTMVGVWLPPSSAGSVCNLSLAMLGKVSVNLNYSLTPDTLRSVIRQAGLTKILTSRLFTHKVPIDPGEGVELVYLDDFRKTITAYERVTTMMSVLLVPRFVQERWILGLGRHKADDLLTVIFSSGSTGEPKGVMLTHANLASNCESAIQALHPVTSDRILGILPFFHSFGYMVAVWLPLQIGMSVVYHVNPLQAREIGALCKTHKCTILVATPTFLRSYIKRCEADDFLTIRILVCGAERLPMSVADEFEKKFRVRPAEGYGCTELSPVAAVNVVDYRTAHTTQIGTKLGTIGMPIPNVAARIVDRETLVDLPVGKEGLLLIKGPNVMRGYLGHEELTRKKIIDGWYITGDLAKLDDDGFLTITGREERFAKVAGEMVPLERVEEEIHRVLGTSDRVVAVTAIPDARRGERIVVLHLPLEGATPEEVSKKLGERGLPNLFIPGARDFFAVDELPILGSGKLDLKNCQKRALELAQTPAVAE
jgi:acyl-[acyl-carrier-protein]-phospholipid O-acyltransferase / long-chain-fatty-acid--[acyl-carrier-protein] ligase